MNESDNQQLATSYEAFVPMNIPPASESPLLSELDDDDDPAPPTPRQRIGLALFACLQNALVGGIVFGWASIDRTMLKASTEKGGANLNATETTQLFAYASCTAMMASLFLGPILDAYGPRVCLVLSHALVVVGCTGFALSQQLWQFALSVVIISFGGPGVGLAIIHVANLFPNNKFLAVSCLAGSVTLSFSMLAILEVMWEHWHVSFRLLFGGYSGVAAISMTLTFLLSPDEPYDDMDDESDMEEAEDDAEAPSQEMLEKQETGSDFGWFVSQNNGHPSVEQEFIEATIHTYAHHHQHPFLLTDQPLTATLRCEELDEDVDYEECQKTQHSHHSHQHSHHHDHNHRCHHFHKSPSFYKSQQALQLGNEKVVKLMSLKDQPFMVQLQSPTFARALIIFVTTSFLANFTIASLNTELEDVSPFSETQQHHLSQQFTWLLSLGMVYALLVGWLMDRMGLEVCTLLTLVLGQISNIFMLLASSPMLALPEPQAYVVMVWSFALYSLFRQFLFPVFLAYITARLGFKYFGILSGIGFALSGMVQWFMAQLVHLIHHRGVSSNETSGWLDFHIFQVVVLACLMIIPIADHRDIKRREIAMEQALQELSNGSSKTGNINGKSPRSTASTATATTTSVTPLWRERRLLNNDDSYYGSMTNNV